MASRNKREGGYCGKWRDFEENVKHRRVGNPNYENAFTPSSLKQTAKWQKGEKQNG